MLDVKVGDMVVLQDNGRKSVQVEITSETHKSFCVSSAEGKRKFDKRTGVELTTSWGSGRIFSLTEYDAMQWIGRNRSKIAQAVSDCNNIDKLKRIWEILE